MALGVVYVGLYVTRYLIDWSVLTGDWTTLLAFLLVTGTVYVERPSPSGSGRARRSP